MNAVQKIFKRPRQSAEIVGSVHCADGLCVASGSGSKEVLYESVIPLGVGRSVSWSCGDMAMINLPVAYSA